jgi:hypothetical protein
MKILNIYQMKGSLLNILTWATHFLQQLLEIITAVTPDRNRSEGVKYYPRLQSKKENKRKFESGSA